MADEPTDTPEAVQEKDWNDLRDRGQKAHDRGDYGVAHAYFRRAMAVGAPAAIACNDIACTYDVEGQIDEALAWWQRSAQADAGYVYPRFNTGRVLALQGHHEEALTELCAAAAIDAGHRGCRRWAGLVCLKLGRMREAETYLREEAALDSESQGTQNILAYCVAARAHDWPEAAARAETQGYADLDAREYDFAHWWFQQAIHAGSDAAKMLNEIGRCHDNKGDTDRALACWHEAARTDPTLVYPPFNIGVKLEAAGDFESSLRHLQIAIGNDPHHNWARLHAGWACLNLDRVDEAAEHYRQAAAIDPNVGAVANHLAYCEARLRSDQADVVERAERQGYAEFQVPDYSRAHWWFHRAIADGAPEANMLNEIGRVHEARGDIDQAIATWRRAAELDSNLVYPVYNIGRGLRRANQAEAARPYLERALEIQSDYFPAHFELGSELLNSGLPQEAEPHYRRVIEAEPENALYNNDLAYCLALGDKDLDEARERAERANQLEPGNFLYLDTLAVIYAKMFWLLEACAILRRALVSNPDDAEITSHLDDVRREMVAKRIDELTDEQLWERADALMADARARRESDDLELACDRYRRAARIWVGIGDMYQEGLANNQLGLLLGRLGRHREAINAHEASYHIITACNASLSDRIVAAGLVAQAERRESNWGEAARWFDREALLRREANAKPAEIAEAERDCAKALISHGQHADAVFRLEAALELDSGAGAEPGPIALDQLYLGRAWEARRSYDKALLHYETALELSRGIDPQSLDVAVLLVDVGDVERARGNADAAREAYQRAVAFRDRLDPESTNISQILRKLGKLANEREDWDEALQCFRRALAIDRNAEPNSRQVAIDLSWVGWVHHRMGDHDTALDIYLQAVNVERRRATVSVQLADFWMEIGDLHRNQDRHADSIDYYHRGVAMHLRLQPQSARAAQCLKDLAGAYEAHGDLPSALRYHGRALRIDERIAPEAADTAAHLMQMAELCKQQGDHNIALEHCEHAVAITEVCEPKSKLLSTRLNTMGQLLNSMRDQDRAIDCFQRALAIEQEIDPTGSDLPTRLNNIGYIHELKGDRDKALGYYLRALETNDRAGVHTVDTSIQAINVGNQYLVGGDVERALGYYQHALAIRDALGPRSSASKWALFNIGKALLSLDRVDEALEPLVEAQSLAPDEVRIQELVGSAHLRHEQPDLAEMAYRRALETEPDSRDCLVGLARALLAQDVPPDEARSVAERACQVDPGHGVCLGVLGWACLKQGLLIEALSLVRTAARLVEDDEPIREHLCAVRGALTEQRITEEDDEALIQRAKALTEEGKLLRADGKHYDACKRLARALLLWTGVGSLVDEALAHNQLGLALEDLDDWEAAAREHEASFWAFDKAGSTPKNRAVCARNAARTLEQLPGCSGEAQWRERAVSLLEEAEADEVEIAIASRECGWAFQAAGEHAEALPHLTRSLELDTEHRPDGWAAAWDHVLVGRSHELMGDYELALEHYHKALERNLSTVSDCAIASTWSDVGDVERKRGENDAARAAYERALEAREQAASTPEATAKLLRQLGNLCRDMGDTANAIAYHERALDICKEIDPEASDTASAFNQLGLALSEAGRYDDAIACLNKALAIDEKLDPTSIWTAIRLSNLGSFHGDMGNLDTALEYYGRSLTLRRQIAPASQAEAELLECMAIDVANHGSLERAVEYCEQALRVWERLDPESHRVLKCLKRLSDQYKTLGRRDVAVQRLRGALALHERQIVEDNPDSIAAAYRGFLELGNRFDSLDDDKTALRCYKRALALCSRLDAESIALSEILRKIGWVHSRRDRHAYALEYFVRALQMSEQYEPESFGVAESLRGLGAVYSDQGDLARALDCFERGAAILTRDDNDALLAVVYLRRIADIQRERGYLDKSLATLRRALTIVEATDADDWRVARVLIDMGLVHRSQGNLAIALEHFERAYARTETEDRSGWTSRHALWQIGILRDMQGDVVGAKNCFKRVLAVEERVAPDALDTAGTVRRIGDCCADLGDQTQALDYYERALRIAVKHQADDDLVADILDRSAAAWRARGREDKATECERHGCEEYERLLELRMQYAGESEGVAECLAQIGKYCRKHGHLSRAREALSRALAIHQTLAPGSQSVANALRDMALLHEAAEEPADEIACYEKRLAILQRICPGSTSVAIACMSIAYCHNEHGRCAKARPLVERAIEIAESLRTRAAGGQKEKSRYFARFAGRYEYMVRTLFRLDQRNEAFRYAERAKARGMLELLAERSVDPGEHVDRELLDREAALKQRLSGVYREVDDASRRDDRDEDATAQLLLEQDDLERKLLALQREIRRQCPAYAELQYPKPVDVNDVDATLLGDDGVLLEYLVGERCSYAWCVTPTNCHAVRIEVGAAELEQRVRTELRSRFDVPEARGLRSAEMEQVEAAQWIYETFVKPVEETLRQGLHVVVVPDGALHYVPFEMLVTGRADDWSRRQPLVGLDYLGELFTFSYVPSATVLKNVRDAEARREAEGDDIDDLLAFGDPDFDAISPNYPDGERTEISVTRGYVETSGLGLGRIPATGREVRCLHGIFGGQRDNDESVAILDAPSARCYLRHEASERRALQESGGYRYVHFATHGLLDDRNPLYSGIALSPTAAANDPDTDELLQAFEIFGMDLHASLVTLSACQTGLGKLERGEGLVGLTRAFFYAGAPSVVVSLWSVADEPTAEFMELFYSQLRAGVDKGQALAQARREMMRRQPDPFYWAPFILQGDWRRRPSPQNTQPKSRCFPRDES